MTTTLKPYLACIRATLEAALCLRNFPSQSIERQNRPEIEDKSSKELLLQPLAITRSERESVLIEPSINSVRVSVRIKQSDELERLLAGKLSRFLMQRAEQFVILRRKPIEGFDMSVAGPRERCARERERERRVGKCRARARAMRAILLRPSGIVGGARGRCSCAETCFARRVDVRHPRERALSRAAADSAARAPPCPSLSRAARSSFLLPHAHLETMVKARLVDFVITFLEDIDREISAMKIAINARARVVAGAFMEGFVRVSPR